MRMMLCILLALKRAGRVFFLTTDDRIVKTARRRKGLLTLRVDNPVRWLEEVLK